jgi:cation:H+ antiporter
MPEFVFVQWIAPLVSEFPELASTLYWARRDGRATMSLMNVVSSNINQWTMLTAMLPVVYSISIGTATPIVFDHLQSMELWLTYGQAVIGLIFLLNMEFAWWEALVLAVLFVIPFASKATEQVVTYLYFVWAAIEIIRMIAQRRLPRAFPTFLRVWREHVA